MGEAASHLREECGIFGIYAHNEASTLTNLGLHALQHRGQESAGIVTSTGKKLHGHKDMGLVTDVFTEELLEYLRGHAAIGHVRYSTSGSSLRRNAQPQWADCWRGQIAVAHNGNLINAHRLRSNLEAQGQIFTSTSDTEVVLHLIARSRCESLEDAIVDALQQLEGAYSLVVLTENQLIGVRDPRGFRPLSLGKLGPSTVIASESCAFDIIEAKFERDIRPGEMVIVDSSGIRSLSPFPPQAPKRCIFEYVYFSRPDSVVYGRGVDRVRIAMGRQLAREGPVDADFVMPVPDSSLYAALGYARESGIPFDMALIRNHYVGRTFIEPKQSIRDFGVKLKFNPVRELLEGRRVIVVDDSIVRGTTSQKIVNMIRSAGAKEVHFRVSSPPWKFPCFYGIDTPSKGELIGSSYPVAQIEKYLGVDSLRYLSLEGMIAASGGDPDGYCLACFNGDYSVPVAEGTTKLSNEIRAPVQLEIHEARTPVSYL